VGAVAGGGRKPAGGVGVIAFTLASLLIVDLGLNWRELTTRRK
jgi:hypothetical protein